ncbi:MAG: hypothetical protein AAF998_17755 [Bacteroidota bacterium]
MATHENTQSERTNVESQESSGFGLHPLSETGFSNAAAPPPASRSAAPFQLQANPEVSPAAPGRENPVLELASRPTDAPAQNKSESAPVQRQEAEAESEPETREPYVPYQIYFDRDVSGEQFKIIIMQQVFGAVVDNIRWRNIRDQYSADESPVTVEMDVSLLLRERIAVNQGRGIETDAEGGVSGSSERREAFNALPRGNAERSSLTSEIDRRFYESTGLPPGTSITDREEDEGMRQLWGQLQDEVLFQHEYIRNLPPEVQEFIRYSTDGRVLTPADYDALMRIARTIQSMPPENVPDYLSKVSGTTTDLAAFEQSLHTYNEEMARRSAVEEENLNNQAQLAGLEAVYEKYRLYRTLNSSGSLSGDFGGIVAINRAFELREEIDRDVRPFGFSGVEEFEQFITDFERTFELQSQSIALSYLERFRGSLFREQQRYRENAVLQDLQARIQAGTTKQELAAEFSIFEDSALPDDRKVDMARLAAASSPEALGRILRGYVETRTQDVTEVLGHIEGDSSVIFKLDALLPQFYAQQNIAEGSIYAMIIEDKIRRDMLGRVLSGIILAIVAVALAVVSGGSAVPAMVAAGAGLTGFGIGAYAVYEEYRNYALENDIAEAGLADDPSMIWLILAVAGAALDLGAAVRAVRALSPAARALNSSGDTASFLQQLRRLEDLGEIDARVARAVERAAQAQQGFAQASDDLSGLLAGGSIRSLADPQVYDALVRMARFKAQEGVASFQVFLREIERARAVAQLGDLQPEELARVRQAWQEGRALAGVADEAAEVGSDAVAGVRTAVETRISAMDRFTMRYSDDEIRAIMAQGERMGFTRQQIEDLILIGSRNDKPLTALQLMDQMGFSQTLRARGFPMRFASLEEFNRFRGVVRTRLQTLGVSVSDVRIQGSAVRSPTAQDVDLLAMITQSEFDDFIRRAYATRITENGIRLDISEFTHDQLLALSRRIAENPGAFNGVARSDFQYNFAGQIIKASPSKRAMRQVLDLRPLVADLQSQFPNLNVDNFTVQTPGGAFDLQPFWQL